MSSTVSVDLGDRAYEIHIGSGMLKAAGSLLKKGGAGRSVLVVSDSNVDSLYGHICEEQLSGAGCRVSRIVVPAGESSKSHEQLIAIYDRALELELDRKSLVVALGGGVVGDLAGYAAASFLRGVEYVQIPTSLLAMVDSAVGGKTGINMPQGKNLIGAFHQPISVIADLDTLKSLEQREYVSGLAEVIKYGVIWDPDLFEQLESDMAAIVACDPDLMAAIVSRCCEIKAEVVRQDEREGGLRAILNFGHTVGHAIEQASGYGKYLHGEAISIGMNFAAGLSVIRTGFSQQDHDRILAVLESAGLPVRAPELKWEDLVSSMAMDKKSVSGVPRFVLSDRIGHVKFGCEVEPDRLAEVWHGCCQ